jgi:hypothetical protein
MIRTHGERRYNTERHRGFLKMNSTSQQIDGLTPRYGRTHPVTSRSVRIRGMRSCFVSTQAVTGDEHYNHCEGGQSNVRV